MRFGHPLRAVFVVVAILLGGDFAVRSILVARADSPAPVRAADASSRGSRGTDPACADGAPMSHRFASGAEWRMCWRIDPHQGLVLSQIVYVAPGQSPLSVIKELSLSQLEVPYDDGRRMTRDITDHGFGGRNMRTLDGADCAGERIAATIPNYGTGAIGDAETRAVLCADEIDGGLGRRSTWGGRPISQRERSFELSTISIVGWYEYVTLFRFGESGAIAPRLGATGDLSPEDFTGDARWGSPVGRLPHEGAVSHSHNAVWRIHWALGDRHTVSEYNADFSGEMGRQSAILEGSWTSFPKEVTRRQRSRRWWRVAGPGRNADGHAVSYKIQLEGGDDYVPRAMAANDGADIRGAGDGDAAFGYDVAFSEYNACEHFASRNLLTHCPTKDVPGFVADRQELRDVVSWVAVVFHHVPRDEDQSPMELHWQGFSMAPFGAFAQNPLTPPNRVDVNGKPRVTP